MIDLYRIRYNTNIGLKRKSNTIYITVISTSKSIIVRRILAIWIWIWLILLLGIITILLIIYKIIII
jgi:formate/nitrite transporter FocA (FNT family)